MNSPVSSRLLLSAADSRDAAPTVQTARQRASRGDNGNSSGSDSKFSDLLPPRHPASTAQADQPDTSGKSGARAHGPKRPGAAQARDDGSAAALLAAAQAGAAGQAPRQAAHGTAAPATDIGSTAATGLAAQGLAASAQDAGSSSALEARQAAQSGPASLARLIHDQLETARPARAQASAQNEPDAAQARTRLAAQGADSQGRNEAAPDASADTLRQIAQGSAGTPAGRAAAHDGHAMARHASGQPVPHGTAAQAMNAAHAADTANAAVALAAQQAPQAGADASAALPDQAAALASIQAAPLATGPDASGSGSAARIGTPLGHPQWAEDFSRQVLILSSGDLRNQSVKLHVTPPELGPLHIVLNLSNNVAHAVFASAHAEVRNAVENALPQLQQALAQNGLALGQANVGDQQQFAQQFHDSADNKPRGSGFALEVAAPATSMAADPAPRRAAGNSLVDTFA